MRYQPHPFEKWQKQNQEPYSIARNAVMNQRNGWDSAPAAIHGTALWRNRSESLPEKAEPRNAPRDFPPRGSVLPSCRKFPWIRKSAFLRESENWIGCWAAEWCPVLWVLVGEIRASGKPTLLLQICRLLAESGKKVLYISGEESLQQIKMRAQRIGQFPRYPAALM